MLSKQAKSKIKRYLFYLVIAFLAVFVLRFCYALYFERYSVFVNYGASQARGYYYDAAPSSAGSLSSVRNVASAKISQKDVYTGQSVTLDQKYEKVANMTASTSDFEADNQKLRVVIEEYAAVIQTEKLAGLAGNQTLTMAIGVMPDSFDSLVDAVKEIGNLRSFSVDKIDTTDEFRKLMAEQEILLKTREAYEGIKAKGGDIRDLLMLEDKILQVEAQMQNLGVNLGTYSSENSFCTVNFSLATAAGQPKPRISKSAILECLVMSFIWTVIFYIIAAAIAVFFMICALIIVLIVLKFQKMLPKELKAVETAAVPNAEE